jgi:predicted DNA-binding transcriptional regulator AlpA
MINEQTLTAEDVFEDEQFKVTEVADKLGVRPDTILGWLNKGDVFPHAYKIGPYDRSGWRVPKMDLVAYMEKATGLPSRGNSNNNDEEE